MKKSTAILYLSLILVLLSCSKDEAVFNQSPADRIKTSNAELHKKLTTAKYGYKLVYFTKEGTYGGFTFFLKFKENGTVDMTSDVNDAFDIQTSTYEVQNSSGTELVFSTRNHIHKLSDNNVPGLRGSGYEGNSIFSLVRIEESAIVLKDLRNGQEIKLLPVSDPKEWESVQLSYAIRQGLIADATSPVFQNILIETEENASFYTLNYDNIRLYSNISGFDTPIEFGLVSNAIGFSTKPVLRINNISYEDFTYNPSTKQFVSRSQNTKATIGFFGTPVKINEDALGIGKPPLETCRYTTEWGHNPLTSLGFYALMKKVDSNLKEEGYDMTFNSFQLNSKPNKDGFVLLHLRVDTFWLSYYFSSSIKDKKLYLEYVGPANYDGRTLQNEMQPILEMFGSEEGLYYTNEGTFQTDIANYRNLAGTLTSASSPNLRVYVLWYQ